MALSRKAQVLFEESQYKALEEEAHRQHKGVGSLIREVVEREFFQARKNQQKKKAAEQLCSLDLPMTDWKEVKGALAQSKIKK